MLSCSADMITPAFQASWMGPQGWGCRLSTPTLDSISGPCVCRSLNLGAAHGRSGAWMMWTTCSPRLTTTQLTNYKAFSQFLRWASGPVAGHPRRWLFGGTKWEQRDRVLGSWGGSIGLTLTLGRAGRRDRTFHFHRWSCHLAGAPRNHGPNQSRGLETPRMATLSSRRNGTGPLGSCWRAPASGSSVLLGLGN